MKWRQLLIFFMNMIHKIILRVSFVNIYSFIYAIKKANDCAEYGRTTLMTNETN